MTREITDLGPEIQIIHNIRHTDVEKAEDTGTMKIKCLNLIVEDASNVVTLTTFRHKAKDQDLDDTRQTDVFADVIPKYGIMNFAFLQTCVI